MRWGEVVNLTVAYTWLRFKVWTGFEPAPGDRRFRGVALAVAPLAGVFFIEVLIPRMTRAQFERQHLEVHYPANQNPVVMPCLMLAFAAFCLAIPAFYRRRNAQDKLAFHALAVACLGAAVAAAIHPVAV
jgi:hypothetical protein